MAVRLKQNNLKLSGAITGAFVIAGSILLLRTFPHIKSVFTSESPESKSTLEEDNTPVPIEGDYDDNKKDNLAHELAPVDDAKDLNDEEIRSILREKEINPPSNATRDELVAIFEASQ